MNREIQFSYNGKSYIFCGFCEGKFAFYCDGKAIFVESIKDLELVSWE